MSTKIKLNKNYNLQESTEGIRINKISAAIAPTEFVKLLQLADNHVNPRTAKTNSITKSIQETLDNSPELMWYKSKGILLSTESLKVLQRNRIEITFDNPDYEGIMDGGHNTFAIASWIVNKLFDVNLSTWAECKEYWKDHYNEILEAITENNEDYNFSIPIEIIYPNDKEGSLDDYYDHLAEICAARNNNVQLRETAKGNQVGYYDHLKDSLGPDFDIIWKTGESGKIKSEDVIALSCLPIFLLQQKEALPSDLPRFKKMSIYSQKMKCVDFFNKVMKHADISDEDKGKYTLIDPAVKSALDLTKDILCFFDRLFIEFPKLYHSALPGKFGRIGGVDNKKTKLPFHTMKKQSDYKYSYGFFYPLACGITELMDYNETTGVVTWSKNPSALDFSKLDLTQYVELIKMVNYDPQKIGKGTAFYTEAESVFKKL